MTRRVLFMAAATVALMAAPASADEHRNRVAEIFLADAAQGDLVQFVELFDPMGEPFPEEDYHLGIYDTTGALLGTVPIDPPPGTFRYLVATPAAEATFGVQADAPLTMTLPTEGQVCFEVVEEGETERISCVGYGCLESVVEGEFATETGMAPFDGQSIQRRPVTRTFEMNEPTPNRANIEGTAGLPDCAPPPPPPDDDDDDGDQPPDDQPPDDQPPIVDDDDGGCRVAGGDAPAGLAALAGLGLIAAMRRRRRRR